MTIERIGCFHLDRLLLTEPKEEEEKEAREEGVAADADEEAALPSRRKRAKNGGRLSSRMGLSTSLVKSIVGCCGHSNKCLTEAGRDRHVGVGFYHDFSYFAHF